MQGLHCEVQGTKCGLTDSVWERLQMKKLEVWLKSGSVSCVIYYSWYTGKNLEAIKRGAMDALKTPRNVSDVTDWSHFFL